MRNPFRYFNSSPEVIRLTVMMYVRYPLSLRNCEDLLAERGIDVSYETVRFGPLTAPVEALLTAYRLRAVAKGAGVTQIVSGPKAIAISFARPERQRTHHPLCEEQLGVRWSGDWLIYDSEEEDAGARLIAVEQLLTRLAA